MSDESDAARHRDAERRRTGRPPKPPGEALSERITIRLTRAEADTLDRVAQRHRVPTAAVIQGLVRRSLASFRPQ